MSFAFPIRVYWEDTDAGGIVFYANYLKFMERARTEWLRSLGIEQQKLRETSGGIFVVSETTLKYHRSARLDDQLLVTAQLRQAGTASLIIDQRVLSNPERKSAPEELPAQALLCEGTIRIGWVNAASIRPSRLPASVSTVFERIVSSGTPPGAASQQ
ncbi:MAG: YbgC/FadM family acyl-CoA thioesterase [Proteobacteria bacterium]|nr:YbgC/FadM family acyl-CoA thioesterase [Pseudomonadota bacterium]